MFDVAIRLENRPGAMAEMGEALGAAGVSVEGGGGWVADGKATMHFLFVDGEATRQALENAGIEVLDVREVLVQRLRQSAWKDCTPNGGSGCQYRNRLQRSR